MFRRISDRMFGLRKIGKYLADADLRKAYKDYKQSEEVASRLILNTILSEGWLGYLSQPHTLEEISEHFEYINLSLLRHLLNFLERANHVQRSDGSYSIRRINTTPIAPSDLGTVLANFYLDCSNFLPNALRGKDYLKLEEVPRIVLASVFGSPLLQIGREVLFRNFVSGKPLNVGIAAFADMGIIHPVRQVNELFGPEQIHVFVQNYRAAPSFTSLLRLSNDNALVDKVAVHLWGTDIVDSELRENLDLFFGEEFFAFVPSDIEQKTRKVADYLKPGARVITDDPTVEEESEITAAYILMQCIKGYPQPLKRLTLKKIFQNAGLNLKTAGDNWLVAEKEVSQ